MPIADPMIVPEPDGVYLVELCSGEQRYWRYLGPDARLQTWWCDLESGREFNESGVMYSWWIVRREDPSGSS
jgi:hypothetical protein